MSNTAEVTPFVDDANSTSTPNRASLAAGLAGLLRRSSADQQADDALSARRRADRLEAPTMTVLGATLTPLVQAASDLGYRPLGLGHAGAGSAAQDRIELVNPQGLRLELHARAGTISLQGTAPTAARHAVVRQRTLRAVEQHLTALSGGKVEVRKRPDGSIEMKASEKPADRPDGDARVSVVVNASGELAVDIDNVRGTRCESVLDGIAKAAGGRARNKKIKPAYYEADTAIAPSRAHLRK